MPYPLTVLALILKYLYIYCKHVSLHEALQEIVPRSLINLICLLHCPDIALKTVVYADIQDYIATKMATESRKKEA